MDEKKKKKGQNEGGGHAKSTNTMSDSTIAFKTKKKHFSFKTIVHITFYPVCQPANQRRPHDTSLQDDDVKRASTRHQGP